ncbi:hypothetical protein FHETE_7641 [Fusarium heterosporum]|uniref:Uncharacterized protein n=1 Tax=Fusarium heterosporum TaxID=42747 RepID=A0A8H5T5U6_FUSHE|nr:hypothetical protein FHETE_7641 [Fusarium heterosporum]
MGAVQNKPKAPNSANRVFKTTKTITIPNLTELRKELGYDNPGQQEDISFKRAIREQVESFVSPSEDLPGHKFTKWKSESHQRGLLDITKDFLDTKGNGPRFWPDRHSSTKERSLEYSKDFAKIRRLMIKVFWRTACEFKRYKASNPTLDRLLPESNELYTPPEEVDIKPIDTRPQVVTSTDTLKGLSVDNPIDIEDMQPDIGITAPLRDIDPFLGAELPNFTTFASGAPENTSDEWPSSEPYASLFPSSAVGDIPDCRPLEVADRPQTVQPENMRGADLYDGPNSPPAVTQNSKSNGKRPAETNPNDNDRQAKAPRQDQSAPERHATKAGKKAQSAPTAVRRSNRERRAPDRPGVATEEELEAADHIPTPSSPERGRYADQGQQAKDKADSSKASTSHSRGTNDVRRDSQRQSSTESSRVEVARLAERRTTALHAMVEEEADINDRPRCIVNILANVRGKRPTPPQRQIPVTQAGSSRERESLGESAPQPAVDVTQTESRPPLQTLDTAQQVDPNSLSHDERRALDACEITHRSNIKSNSGKTYVKWTPSAMIFFLSLADVARELGVEGPQRLFFKFKHRWANFEDDFGRAEGKRFRTVMREWLGIINEQCTENALLPAAQRPELEFQVYISKAPIMT